MIRRYLPKNWEACPHHRRTLAHSRTVANAAKLIASRTKSLDPEMAYQHGLLHDIGKFYLQKEDSYKHPRKGYELLKDSNQRSAIICLTHPFPNLDSYDHVLQYHHNDELEARKTFELLQNIELDDYIELIQFCDKVSRIDDYIPWEEKLRWYLETYHLDPNDLTRQYDRQLSKIKNKLDEMTNSDVYEVLGIISV